MTSIMLATRKDRWWRKRPVVVIQCIDHGDAGDDWVFEFRFEGRVLFTRLPVVKAAASGNTLQARETHDMGVLAAAGFDTTNRYIEFIDEADFLAGIDARWTRARGIQWERKRAETVADAGNARART